VNYGKFGGNHLCTWRSWGQCPDFGQPSLSGGTQRGESVHAGNVKMDEFVNLFGMNEMKVSPEAEDKDGGIRITQRSN
jgi:hypothetical protein